MTFLNPAVLFGLLAAAIPVIIHLLNLRKLKTIEFSTLTFLKEMQKNKIKKIKIRQWLLLALRVLIILFIVASFARPALRGVVLGGTTSSAKTSAVFILDNTFSMSAIGERGSYFNHAKQTAKSLLEELQDGDEAALITVGSSEDESLRLTSNLFDIKTEIDHSDITYKSGTLHSAVVKAAELLSGSENFNKEIYLFSDFQPVRISEKPKGLSDLGSILNESVKLYNFDFSGKDIFNVGIDSLLINNQIFEKGKTISFTADVTNYSQQPVNNFVASLFLNGERSAQQSVSIEAGQSKRITFETVLNTSGYINVMAELEDDDILHDNRQYIDIVIPEKISVIIFTNTETDSRFLELALGSYDEEHSSIALTRRNLNQLLSVNLSNYDVVIITGSAGSGNLDRINEYVNSGGSLLLMPGSNSDLNSFRNILTSLQLPVPASAAGSVNDIQNFAVFDKIDFNHPVFSNIFERTAKKQVESPEIYHYFRFVPQGTGKQIISLIDNSSFLSEFNKGKGRVMVMNTAPVLSWNNLPLKGIFVPLINKSVFYLASKDNQINSYIAGEHVNINLQNNALPQIRILHPDNNADFANVQNNRNYFSYDKTPVTGSYKVYSGDQMIDHFSVNTDPLESNTKRSEDGQFSDYLEKINFKGQTFSFDPADNYASEIQQARFGSELWKPLLMLALILAIIEMMISRSAKKDLVQ